MLANLLVLAATFQVLPFYQQAPARDFYALRPFWAQEGETTDVLWPLFTAHRDWWRACLFTHYQSYPQGGYQFEVMPLWWNGRENESGDAYWGLFPFYGRHPHILMLHDWEFVLWPVWMRYRMPRAKDKTWMTSNAVLFPFIHWRDDGSWGFWPFYTTSHNRADDHTSVLWPLWNWKTSFADRDTGGAGTSWMLWPLLGRVDRERESQWLFLPPFFSWAETRSPALARAGSAEVERRVRCPLPLVEIERFAKRSRTSVFPFYEHIENYRFFDRAKINEITRYGWRLVELLPDETRVFPFWVRRPDDTYFRLWPFWETLARDDAGWKSRHTRCLSLFPIRWVPAVDRNWSKFWTFYERVSDDAGTRHSLLWGLIRWTTD